MIPYKCFISNVNLVLFIILEVLILPALSCVIRLSLSLANETSLYVTIFLGNTVHLPSLNNIAAGGKPVAV